MGISTLIFFISFALTFSISPWFICQLKRAGIVGRDLHKPGQPDVAEMGGLVIVAGFSAGVVMAIAIEVFFGNIIPLSLVSTFAVLSTVLLISLIGIVDDLIFLPQGIKAITPLFASFPLMAIRAGHTVMSLPWIGPVDFDFFYPLLIVPLGITGAANAVNMLAGFNGLEVGMGIVAMVALSIIACFTGAATSFIILLASLGALVAVLRYNWYPARLLIGDVGTLSIGAIIASAVILGNFELAGAIVIIPYFVDFLFKVYNGFPSKGWAGVYRNGKLYCPSSGPVGLCQMIMRISGGISERALTISLIGIESGFGVLAVVVYCFK